MKWKDLIWDVNAVGENVSLESISLSKLSAIWKRTSMTTFQMDMMSSLLNVPNTRHWNAFKMHIRLELSFIQHMILNYLKHVDIWQMQIYEWINTYMSGARLNRCMLEFISKIPYWTCRQRWPLQYACPTIFACCCELSWRLYAHIVSIKLIRIQ